MSASIKKYGSMDYYLIASFCASMLIWMSLYFFEGRPVIDSFFASTFVVGSYFFLHRGIGQGILFRESKNYAALFIFQIVTLVGLSLQEQVVGAIYLALIPSCMGHYHSVVFEGITKTNRNRTGLGFFVIPLLGMAIFESIFDRQFLVGQEGIFAITFLMWSVMTIYTGSSIFRGKDFSVASIFNRRFSTMDKMDRDRDDRLFFHDIINQTHGINLMLSNRISKGVGVDSTECRDLMGEIRIIQAQIKDHYKFSHKNLVNNYEYVSFDFARRWIERTVDSFLPTGLVESTFVYRGLVSPTASKEEKKKAVIHYPSFSRILTNLIKNISEVKAHDVYLEFEYDGSGLLCTVKNKVFDQEGNVVNLEHKLRESILNSSRNPVLKNESGIGLESISSICREQGGDFHFYLEDGYWVNKVFLPTPHVNGEQLAA